MICFFGCVLLPIHVRFCTQTVGMKAACSLCSGHLRLNRQSSL